MLWELWENGENRAGSLCSHQLRQTVESLDELIGQMIIN